MDVLGHTTARTDVLRPEVAKLLREIFIERLGEGAYPISWRWGLSPHRVAGFLRAVMGSGGRLTVILPLDPAGLSFSVKLSD